eukprot:gene14260-biopygen12647
MVLILRCEPKASLEGRTTSMPAGALSMEDKTSLLSLRNLTVSFQTNDGTVEAVKGIDLTIQRNEIVAIVGESGSGKSQTMMALIGLLAANGTASGEVAFDGGVVEAVASQPLKRHRGNAITMIFQEPMTSLDPLYRIG